MKKDIYRNIKNGSLKDLLSVCTDEELYPLVELIIGKKTNSLIKNDKYIKFKPHHTKYYDVIAEEIRYYGSSSIGSLYKDNVDYSTIVKDVAIFLDLPIEENEDIVTIEKQIYNILKIEYMDIENNLNGLFSFVMKKFLKKTVKPKITFNPLSEITRIIDGLKSYDVTVPSVAYIAYLRKKILKRLFTKNELYNKLELLSISCDKGTLVDIFIIENNKESLLNNATKLNIDKINPLLSLIPNLAIFKNVKNTRYMEVVINGDLSQRTGGGYIAMTHEGGKIKEHATLFEPDKLNNLINTGVLFHIASFVVAQKHLADINNQLKNINKKIDKIIEFQQDKRISSIEGKLQYLNIISKDLKNIHISELETIDRELLEIERHLFKDLDKIIRSNINDEDIFGSESFFNNMKDIMQESYIVWNTLLLCLKVRLYSVFLYNTLENNKLIQIKKDDISTKFNILFEKSNDINKKFLIYITQIDSIFNLESTLKERKLILLKQHNNFIKNREIEKANMKSYLLNKNNNQKANIILELDNNSKVLAAYI